MADDKQQTFTDVQPIEQTFENVTPIGQTSMRAQPAAFSKEWLKSKLYNQVLDPATEALPAAGATVGAILGGGAAGAGSMGLATLAGGAGGATVGGMAGEAAKQLARRYLGFEGAPQTSQEASNAIMRQGAIQGGIQGATEGLSSLAGPLGRSAATQYERALAPTTKANKFITKKITPELIERGEYGSLQGLGQTAEENLGNLRPQLNAAYTATPASATAGSGTQIIKDLEAQKGKYIVNGISANPAATDSIEKVQDLVRQYGPDIDPDSLRKLKHIWDEPVASKGGFAGTDLATQYTLRAQKQASDSIRNLMGKANPEVADLNKEMSFWLNVKKVTSESGLRRTGQSGGLNKVFAPIAAAVSGSVGFSQGGAQVGLETAGATALAVLAAQVSRSPLYRTASAVLKDRFADALASGSVGDISALATRFGVAYTERMLRDAQKSYQPPPQTGQ